MSFYNEVLDQISAKKEIMSLVGVVLCLDNLHDVDKVIECKEK